MSDIVIGVVVWKQGEARCCRGGEVKSVETKRCAALQVLGDIT